MSAWGSSWLKAWGNSWGLIAETRHTGGGDGSHVDLVKLREGIKRAQEERDRIEAERDSKAQREAAEVLARIARAKEPEPLEPIVIPLPGAVEPEPVSKVEPLAPVNDLVESVRSAINLVEPAVVAQTLLINEQISRNEQRKRDQDDAIALIMILAEID